MMLEKYQTVKEDILFLLVDKYDLPVEDENGKVVIDFKQFMSIMTENIIKNRERFGREATQYESGKFIFLI
ncbi:MAG: hypothetical protein MJ252_01815 [archaeon]|nr:hypothetical protein [archaeon]